MGTRWPGIDVDTTDRVNYCVHMASAQKSKGPGRPPLPVGVSKGELVKYRATSEELERLDQLAGAWGVKRSEAARRAVDEAHARATGTARRGAR